MLTDLFPARELWLLAGVLAMAIVSALFETLSVASILPFMSLVLDPSAADRYPVLLALARSIGVTSPHGVPFSLRILTAAMVALGNTTSGLNLLVHERFGARTGVRLTTALFAGYLAQPYAFRVQRDAPSLLKVMLTDAQVVTTGILNPFFVAVSKAFVVVGMLTLLFLHDPALVCLTVSMILVAAYFIVFGIVRARQRQHGSEFNRHNLDRQRIPQEGLGGVKELQILGRERYTIERFEAAARGAALAGVSNRMTAHLPRYVLETIAVGGILLLTLMLLADGDKSAGAVIPVLALYAFAGYRLLPALQQIFASAVTIRFHLPVLQGLHGDFVQVNAVRQTSPGRPSIEGREVHFSDASTRALATA
jgi:ABC-type multidrug transport system fused ATPase/permease subunit